MDRPEDIAEWAWSQSNRLVPGTVSRYTPELRNSYQTMVARALIEIREKSFSEAAKIAEEYGGFTEDTGSPPSDFTNSGKNEAAADIASAIRQHSQKGEK